MDVYRISDLLGKEEKLNKLLSAEQTNRQSLIDSVNRRFTTSIIGALDAIQKDIGFLWGDQSSYNMLSPDQKRWRELWIDLRKTILDKGHAQARAAIADIETYNTSLKHRYTFGIKEPFSE